MLEIVFFALQYALRRLLYHEQPHDAAKSSHEIWLRRCQCTDLDENISISKHPACSWPQEMRIARHAEHLNDSQATIPSMIPSLISKLAIHSAYLWALLGFISILIMVTSSVSVLISFSHRIAKLERLRQSSLDENIDNDLMLKRSTTTLTDSTIGAEDPLSPLSFTNYYLPLSPAKTPSLTESISVDDDDVMLPMPPLSLSPFASRLSNVSGQFTSHKAHPSSNY